jgi:hypothetical protein
LDSGLGIAVGAVAAVGVAAGAALEMVGGGEDGVGAFEVEVFGLECGGFADRLFGWLER